MLIFRIELLVWKDDFIIYVVDVVVNVVNEDFLYGGGLVLVLVKVGGFEI